MKFIKQKIEDICELIGGGTPSTSNDSFWDGEVPWITPKDLSGYVHRYISKGERNITDEGLKKSSARLMPANSVLLTTRAPVGYVAIAKNQVATNQGFKNLVCNSNKVDYRFIYYLLKENKSYLESQATGATYKELSGGRLKNLEFYIPPINVQSKIADHVSTYDDLIENNLRRIELLEKSAQLLYKEWFVNLRFPEYENTRIIDGVPEGWERKKLGEVIILNYGKSLKAENRLVGNIPVYGSSGIIGKHDIAIVKGSGIVVGRKGNAGSVFWSQTEFFPIDTTYYISSEQSNLFLYYNLLNQNFQSSHGAVPGLNRDSAYSKNIIIPHKNVLQKFLEIVNPMHKQIFSIENSSKNLIKARDLLLPKLINGEIEV